jgi:hypothetical protein
MGPPLYMRPVVDRNVVMRRIPVIMFGVLGEHLLLCQAVEWSPWDVGDQVDHDECGVGISLD